MNALKYLSIVLIIVIFGCRNRPRIESPLVPANYFVLEEVTSLPDSVKNKFPDWVEPGVKCFGIVSLIDSLGEFDTFGFAVPCQVMSYHVNGVRCKVIRNVYPYESYGCQVIGIRKGETWMETDGDLFQTEKDALMALHKRMPKRRQTVGR